MVHVLNIGVGVWSLKEGFGEDFGFALGILEFEGGGLGFKNWGLDVEGLGFEFRKI